MLKNIKSIENVTKVLNFDNYLEHQQFCKSSSWFLRKRKRQESLSNPVFPIMSLKGNASPHGKMRECRWIIRFIILTQSRV